MHYSTNINIYYLSVSIWVDNAIPYFIKKLITKLKEQNFNLQKISKTIFLEMFSMGILNTSKKELKEFTVTCRKKPARHKTRYVHDGDYNKWLYKKNNKINPS